MQTFQSPLIVQNDKGALALNPDHVGERFTWVPLDNDGSLSLPASGGASGSFRIQQGPDHTGDFEAIGLVAYATVPCTVDMRQVGVDSGIFSNAPIHIRHCMGKRGRPFVLAESLWIQAGGNLQLRVTNLTAVAGTLKAYLIGRETTQHMHCDARAERARFLGARRSKPYWLTFDKGQQTVSSGATQNQLFMSVPGHTPFVPQKLMIRSRYPFQFKLKDAQQGFDLTQDWIDSRAVGGDGEVPAALFGNSLFQPQRSLCAEVQDLSLGGTNTIWMTFHGKAIDLPIGWKRG